MANPQKENGYMPISNELLDVIIKTNFNATHFKIILCCCRYTYGFSRKQAELSEKFLEKATGISKRYISKELNTLIEMKVITEIKASTYTTSRIIALNKNYDEWGSRTIVPQVNPITTVEPEQDTTVEQLFNTTVEQLFHQDKQNIKQNIKQVVREKEIDEFFENIWKLYPKKEGKGSVGNPQKKRLYKLGLETMTKCIERYLEAKSDKDIQFIKMGSTFFNSGYVDYLDENYQKQEELPTNTKGGMKIC